MPASAPPDVPGGVASTLWYNEWRTLSTNRSTERTRPWVEIDKFCLQRIGIVNLRVFRLCRSNAKIRSRPTGQRNSASDMYVVARRSRMHLYTQHIALVLALASIPQEMSDQALLTSFEGPVGLLREYCFPETRSLTMLRSRWSIITLELFPPSWSYTPLLIILTCWMTVTDK